MPTPDPLKVTSLLAVNPGNLIVAQPGRASAIKVPAEVLEVFAIDTDGTHHLRTLDNAAMAEVPESNLTTTNFRKVSGITPEVGLVLIVHTGAKLMGQLLHLAKPGDRLIIRSIHPEYCRVVIDAEGDRSWRMLHKQDLNTGNFSVLDKENGL